METLISPPPLPPPPVLPESPPQAATPKVASAATTPTVTALRNVLICIPWCVVVSVRFRSGRCPKAVRLPPGCHCIFYEIRRTATRDRGSAPNFTRPTWAFVDDG